VRQRNRLGWLELVLRIDLWLLPDDQIPVPRRLQEGQRILDEADLQVDDRVWWLRMLTGPVSLRRRTLTDPLLILLVLTATVLASAAALPSWLVWLPVGAVAGFALSGSV